MQNFDIVRFCIGTLLCGLGAGAGAGAATAQMRSDHIAEMFAYLPATVALPGADIAEITFFDAEAGIASLGFGAFGLGSGELLARSVPASFGDALLRNIDENWPQLLGFHPRDIRHGMTGVNRPGALTVLALADGAGSGVGPALLANSYAAQDRASGVAYWRGEDYAIDLESRNVDDPFGQGMGAASRIGLRGDVLIQARGWPDFDQLSEGPNPNLANLPSVQAIFSTIDAPEFEGLRLVRAFLVTDPKTFQSDVLQDLGQQNPDDTAIEALREALEPGDQLRVPVWTTGLFVDLANPVGQTGAFIMAYASREDAKQAQAIIDGAWRSQTSFVTRETYADTFGVAPTFVVTGDSPATLAMILRIETPDDARPWDLNLAYLRLLSAYYRRDLPFLSPI